MRGLVFFMDLLYYIWQGNNVYDNFKKLIDSPPLPTSVTLG
ncbi:hypothetical protein SVI_0620 [Shewanella violacea DSS12]|uniref:Uncharacterized protein n=1 Tax=Shewanella violacea (strain JCM 10179 / CIP 106290 / LMG 19151 / DSS12) TaxID=637905 RepID=D4ZFZ2_SHEVD|nr:hypothetical protein SVI_0620 [Shewanella violacea DSS12]